MAISRALHSTIIAIRLRLGLRANVEKIVSIANCEGEPAYTTDTPALWVADSSYQYQVVPDLRYAVVHEGDVVTHDGEVVWAI